MGGLVPAVKERLQREQYYKPFLSRVNVEYGKVFPYNLNETNITYAYPTVGFPQPPRDDFTTCKVEEDTYPADFVFGVATAAYQIEGAWNEDGKGQSIWDEFVRIPGTITNGDTGDVADDFYHKYKEDIQNMIDLGFKTYRMSLSWPRILPDGIASNPNQAGVDFYMTIIDLCIAARIEPLITLYHWDLPATLNDKTDHGGWLNPTIIDRFNEYADFCFKTYGHKVKRWITINEPQSVSWLGYGQGIHAPGRCSPYMLSTCEANGGGGDSTREPYLVAHHLLLSHATAVKTYRDKYQKTQGGEIGLCINAGWAEPWDL